MDIFNIILEDSIDKYILENDKDFEFSELITYDAINIFEYKFENTTVTENDIDNILLTIFQEDKVNFLIFLFENNFIPLEVLSSFFQYNHEILYENCLNYLIDNNIFPYDFNEDYFLLEALYNENHTSLEKLVEIYNFESKRLSKESIEAISDFSGDISIFSYLIHNFYFSEEEFLKLLNPSFSFFKHNKQQKYFYYEILTSVINQELYYLIDKRVLENCLDNDNYEAAKLIIDYNIPISINGNDFLLYAIYNNDKKTFYKILNHTNFDDNFINKHHFEEIFSSDFFYLEDYKALINKYLINICLDYEEDIEYYDIQFYENLHAITLTTIEYNEFDFFVYLYSLTANKLFYKHNSKNKEEILIKSLGSYFIANYLFIENKESIYLEKNDKFISECFEKYCNDTINLILSINQLPITENAVLNAIYNTHNQHNPEFLESFLNHEKIKNFDNLNFALLESSKICSKSFNLLWESGMTYIDNENYNEILHNLIKLNDFKGFSNVVNSDFINNISLNEFAYEAVKHCKFEIFELILNDKRFSSLNDMFNSPYNAILNKSVNSFEWNSKNNYKILELILDSDNLRINSKVILLLNYVLITKNIELFKRFLNKINKNHIKLWKEEFNEVFLNSLKYDKNEFSEFLFYNSFVDISLIEDATIQKINIKNQNKKFIIDILKHINNASSNSLFTLFKETYNKDFDIASSLFRKTKLKQFLIEKQQNLFDKFNKEFISKNMNSF